MYALRYFSSFCKKRNQSDIHSSSSLRYIFLTVLFVFFIFGIAPGRTDAQLISPVPLDQVMPTNRDSNTYGQPGYYPTNNFAFSFSQQYERCDCAGGIGGVGGSAIQQCLNSMGFTIANTGPGSPGFETNCVGAKTVDSLARFQAYFGYAEFGENHYGDVTAYAGLITQAIMNHVCFADVAHDAPENVDAHTPIPSTSTAPIRRSGGRGSRGESDTDFSTEVLILDKTASGILIDENNNQYIEYTFEICNEGDKDLTNIVLLDDLVDLSLGTMLPLGVLESNSCQSLGPFPYVLNGADLEAGFVENTASISSDEGESAEDSIITDLGDDYIPSILIDKESNITNAEEGDTITYTFTITNDGPVDLSSVYLTDDLAGINLGASCPTQGSPISLATGAAPFACTGTYLVGSGETGNLRNNVSIEGTAPFGTVVTSDDFVDVLLVEPDVPSIGITKSISNIDPSPLAIDSVITYEFSIINGPVDLSNVYIEDSLAGVVLDAACPTVSNPISLNAGAPTFTCTGTYEVTTAGEIENSVTVYGISIDDGTTVVDGNDSVTVNVPEPGIPAMFFEKTITNNGTIQAGDTITYEFLIRNDGNVTLTGITLIDNQTDAAPVCSNWPGTPGELLPGQNGNPGQQVICTGSYQTDANDVATGVDNTATANSAQTDPLDSIASTPVVAEDAPGLEIRKSIDTDNTATDVVVGSTVHYDIEVENTGNVPLSNIVVDDSLLGDITSDCVWPGASGALGVNTGVDTIATCDVSYLIQPGDGDVQSGELLLINTADAQTNYLGNIVQSNTDTATIPIETASIRLTKAADVTTVELNELITYTFIAINTGTVPLNSVVISDNDLVLDSPGIDMAACAWGGATGTLQPGEQVECTATYTPSSANGDQVGDIISNVAIVGADATSEQVSVSEESNLDANGNPIDVDVEVIGGPILEITKQVFYQDSNLEINDGGTVNPGDEIYYLITICNTGDTNALNVTFNESLFNESNVNIGSILASDPFNPALSCTSFSSINLANPFEYTVPSTGPIPDTITNTASVSADGVPLVDDTIILNVEIPSGLVVRKFVDVSSPTVFSLDDEIPYIIEVENTGDPVLTGVVISDSALDAGTLACEGGAVDPTNATIPGQTTITCVGIHTVIQADIDNGSPFRNTAQATDGTLSDHDFANAVLEQDAQLTITKAITNGANEPYGLNELIDYQIVVTNNGDLTLNNVQITDGLLGSNLICNWTANSSNSTTGANILAPLEVMTCTGSYQVTQTDLDAGSTVENTASVSSNEASIMTASESADLEQANPELTLTKEIDFTQTASEVIVGSTVYYMFTITNTGTVNINGSYVLDPLSGPVACDFLASSDPSSTGNLLFPGESVPCSSSYVIQSGDIVNGNIVNTATSYGQTNLPAPDDFISSNQAMATIPVDTASIQLTKASVQGSVTAGEDIDYVFIVENTGTVTLTDVAVTDPDVNNPPGVTCDWNTATMGSPASELQPGEKVDCTAAYTTLSTDAGQTITNTAVVGSEFETDIPNGGFINIGDTSNDVEVPVTAPPLPNLVVTKSVDDTGPVTPGTILNYTITVCNTGGATANNVLITDTRIGVNNFNLGNITSNQTPCPSQTFPYTVLTSDAPQIINIANAISDEVTTPVDSNTVTVDVNAPLDSLSIEKTLINPSSGTARAGDIVTFQFVIQNGPTTISGVTLSDPGVDLALNCPTNQTMTPNAFITCTGTYQTESEDFDEFVNTAEVSSTQTGTIQSNPASVNILPSVTLGEFCLDRAPITVSNQCVSNDNDQTDLSGITWNRETNTLFTVENGTYRMCELNTNGGLIRSIQLENTGGYTSSGFHDTEGVVHIGGTRYAVSEERRGRIAVFDLAAGATSVSYASADKVQFDGSFGVWSGASSSNIGLEGIGYDPSANDQIHTVKEKTPMGHYSFNENLVPTSGTYNLPLNQTTTVCDNDTYDNDGLSDLAGMHHMGINTAGVVGAYGTQDHTLILSDELKTVVEYDECGEVSRLVLSNVQYCNGGAVAPTPPQPEGVTMDNAGNLYIASENDQLYIYRHP